MLEKSRNRYDNNNNSDNNKWNLSYIALYLAKTNQSAYIHPNLTQSYNQ